VFTQTRPGVLVAFVLLLIVLSACQSISTATPVALQPTPIIATPTPMFTVVPTAKVADLAQSTALPTPAKAMNDSGRMVVDVSATKVPVQRPVQIALLAQDIEAVYGAQFTLRYDPALVAVQDEYPDLDGAQIRVGAAFPEGQSFVALNRVDAEQGIIDFAATLLNPAEPLVGEAELASLSIIPLVQGEASFDWEEVLLVDRAGMSQPVTDIGAMLSIVAQ